MPKLVQIRNVPDAVHRGLKTRAVLEGLPLSEYLLSEMKRTLERPTRDELLRRIARRAPVRGGLNAAGLVRAERKGR